MKKKLLLTTVIVALLMCLFAVAVSASTYIYSDEDGNELYCATAEFEARNRYEIFNSESGGFAKTDSDGNPITWYVVSESVTDGTHSIVVASIKTADVGAITNGKFTFGNTVTATNVVSVNFFGMNIEEFDDSLFMATSKTTLGSDTEYCQNTNGSYLLCLYLPKTLKAIPDYFCHRSSLRVLEFEDNSVDKSCKEIPVTAFQFCANLKNLSIPEGIETLYERGFRNCLSIANLKFPSTITVLPNDVFHRCSGFETVIYGKNMTKIGYLNSDYVILRDQNKITTIPLKYVYVPAGLITTGGTPSQYFDSHRGIEKGFNSNVNSSVVFFVQGDLAYVNALKVVSDKNFRQRTTAIIDYDTYLANKEEYDNKPSGSTPHVIVYGLTECQMPYSDEGHNMVETNTYKDALSSFTVGEYCSVCGIAGNVTEYEPLLSFLGYSAKIDGDNICLGYRVNQEAAMVCPNITYGVLIAVPGEGEDLSSFSPLNPDLTFDEESVISCPVDKKYADFNLIVESFSANSEYYERPLVMCAYVSDGEKVGYLCHNELDEIAQQEIATAITYKYIAEGCAPKFAINFLASSSDMGTIEGDAYQVVVEGEKTNAVTAVPKDGYDFACWSNGVQTPSIEYTPEDSEELVAYFTPKSTGLPVMTINTENGAVINTKEYYIGCEISLLDTETGNSIGGKVAEIKGRGNSTWEKFDKKPYKFKFDKKQDLFGMGKEKTWVLLADYRDYSLVRNMLALNAGLTMSELEYTSEGQSVELYVNGEYRGVYYLCEQIQVKENRVNITAEDENTVNPEDIGYLIEMDGWAIENASSTPNYTKDGDVYVTVGDSLKSNRAYVIKDPEDVFLDESGSFSPAKAKAYLDYVQGFLSEAIAAAQGNDYNAVENLIDVKSFAQVYIIFEMFKNPDTNYSSVYFYKDVDGKLICGPLWDFDMAVGNVSHKGNGVFESTETLWTAAQNPWFKGLLQFEEFRALVGKELLANADAIRASIASDLAYAREHSEAYLKNFEKWDILGKQTWSNPSYLIDIKTWEEHLNYVENYLDESLDYLIQVYCPSPEAAE